VPSAEPNPTGAVGVDKILKGKPVVNIPGCPANPYNLLGTVLQFATFGTLPALDDLGRPKFAYARTIHEDCPRRAHFDAGRFASKFGDEAHRNGYCLYKLGCKGPATHANCSLNHFVETAGAWPIGIGAPCFGCTEQKVGFRVPTYSTIDVERPTAPGVYPALTPDHRTVTAASVGVAGLIVGGIVGAGYVASKKIENADKE
jgi:hydrogenase small subunit